MVKYPGDWKIDRIKNLVQVITPSVKIKTTDYLMRGHYPIIDQGQKFINGYTNESSVFATNEYVIFGEHTCIVKYVNFAFAQGADGIKVLTAKTNCIIAKYLYYCMSSIKLDASYSRHWLKMREQEIPLPTLKEQTAIADTLAAFDTHISNLTELIAKKKAIRDGALDELMTGRTRLKGFCGQWREVHFDDVIIPKARIGWQGLKKHEYLRFGYSYLISGTDFHDGTISLKNIWHVSRERYDMDANIQVHEGDVLVTKDGTIGKVAIVPRLDKPATLNSGVFVFRTNINLEQVFLYRVLQSSVFEKFISILSAGSTIKHLYQKDLKNFTFMLPPLDEQTAIADTLTALDKEISSLEAERAKISHIRDGAMNDLLTGKVRLIHGNRKTAPEPRNSLASR